MNQQIIAFIGGGNMAKAMVGGLCKNGFTADHILVIEPNETNRHSLASEFGVQVFDKANPVLQSANLVIWAVKPQVFKEAAELTLPYLAKPLHLSIAAGITLSTMASSLQSQQLIRAMPNTPALIGLGMTGLVALSSVTEAQKQWVAEIVATLGQSIWVEQENLIDAVTAVSGSGPAYVFLFAQSMIEAGEKLGLSADQAKQLTLATLQGATELALRSTSNLQELRQQVTSKGGTTYAAITTMQAEKMPEAIHQGVDAAYLRAQELGQELA